ncbi:MAG: amino acid ABC transporter permease [Gulosibacter sp.]|uniref:amino acid ABC transporter permease n=1 Tax=Gulosibacter sp. TaxID=2817531 RepID=UPI003F8F5F03
MLDIFIALLPGIGTSALLFLASLLIGLPLGMAAGWVLHFGSPLVRWAVIVLTEIGRGFPALVTLYLVYFGLPSIGIVLNGEISLIAAFGYITASYTCEIFRSAIAAVPAGQYEAATALSLSRFHVFIYVVMPQATKIVIPPVIGFSIIVMQATSLAFSIGVEDLLGLATGAGTREFSTLPYLYVAGLIYLVGAAALTALAAYLSRRLGTNSNRVPIRPVVQIANQK